MSISHVSFVKKSQVLMCQFEDCWDSKKGEIIHNHVIKSKINPEIGKIRPVVIIYAHKRVKLAIVIPFTTKKPAKEVTNTLYVPAKIMPGVLGRAECWALCDMPQTICTDRLRTVFSGNKNKYNRRINQADSILPVEYFMQVLEKTAKLVYPGQNAAANLASTTSYENTNPTVRAAGNGTLLTDRFNGTASNTISYDGKEWWALAKSTSTFTGDAVAPFDGAQAAKFTEILAEVTATYARVSIDLATIDADWDDYAKVTLSYELVQVGGSDSDVIFRNGTGGGSDATVNATTTGYATTLSAGVNKTVTLPIGTDANNIKPLTSSSLAVVKKNDVDACILLRITKIELHN